MLIYKYPVPITDRFTIEMPINAKILSFQLQYEIPNIWVAVLPNSSLEERKFNLVGTGNDIYMDNVKSFIGTIIMFTDRLVWHLFEMK